MPLKAGFRGDDSGDINLIFVQWLFLSLAAVVFALLSLKIYSAQTYFLLLGARDVRGRELLTRRLMNNFNAVKDGVLQRPFQ
jgi:hypothetical protein